MYGCNGGASRVAVASPRSRTAHCAHCPPQRTTHQYVSPHHHTTQTALGAAPASSEKTDELRSTAILTLIADYIDAQDGSQKKKELLPLVTVHVNARIRAQHTLDAISAIVDKSRKRASERTATEHANKTAEADYKALQETLRTSRQTPTRQNAIKLAHQAVIDAYNGRKKFEHSRKTIAEDRIAHALAELDKKNKAVREQRKKDIEEAKREKKERKEEEKKEKEEKKATEKAEKKAADDKKKNRRQS